MVEAVEHIADLVVQVAAALVVTEATLMQMELLGQPTQAVVEAVQVVVLMLVEQEQQVLLV